MRDIGIDLHRDFMQVSFLERGEITGRCRLSTKPDDLRRFAESLRPDDRVVLESTGFAWPVHALLSRYVGEVIISNPMQTKAIAWAKVKTDKVDADMLAMLLSADMIPPVWVPDELTRSIRQKIHHRTQVANHRRRIKNQVSSVLQQNLIKPPMKVVYTKSGRKWLASVELVEHDRDQLDSLLRLLDAHDHELTICDKRIAEIALDDPACRLLMTIPGIGPNVALALLSSIGDIRRFKEPGRLVGYFGLAPRVRQSGNGPYRTGKISKQGDSHTRHMLTEAALAAVRSPGPLRAFYRRMRKTKPAGIAIVAVARKITIIAYKMLTTGEPYRYAMPSLTEAKLRQLENKTDRKPQHSQSAYVHRRKAERATAESHERAYETHAAQRTKPRKKPAN